ncbi:Xylose operon regulatory protein [Maioricimonas rarisocia]|uniref:Xylose operon regulatory protein n=1 Tax=Maioricimonas rarisocia TaxID=2528026 RepID=A0A517Z4N1_9PLAN|nr:DNA-binding transcriptional regulator [Maioricimonas rarisocia]QDU37395.1 Xylose operon regulatory protein [Maioricimonas rarisocia]
MKRHVALIVETSTGYGRRVLSGIVRFMRMHDEWSVFLEQRDLLKKPPSWLATWKGDGIISRATTPALVEAVAATGVPLVELTDRRADPGLPSIRSDDAAIGRLAAEHLMERGFERFGFCGFTSEAWSKRREEAFVDAVRQAGRDCDVYNSHWHGPGARAWEEEQTRLATWVRSFPRPVGIMACNDIRGLHVLEACSHEDVAVPEEVAVIGVDNDELLCRVSAPPLSSVIPNAEAVGYRAAELLSRLMDDETPAEPQQRVSPLGVATRQSTDVVAIDDPEIAAALHFIRQHACRGLRVDEVTREVGVSRSTLERQLRKYLGRTPQQEIRSIQIKKARELLATTDLSAEQIAPLCGFEHPEYMHVVFKRLTGMTPGAFRRQVRGEG